MSADFQASTLWRVSSFDRLHEQSVMGGLHGGEQQTLLSSTLQAELYELDRRREASDVLEVIAACMRLQEPALIYVRCHDFVWPVTVFPAQMLYHAPRALVEASEKGLAGASVISVEPAVLRPPGHAMRDRVAADASYWPLGPALWSLALNGPRSRLLSEIGGTAAYRAMRNPRTENLSLPGALAPAADRLRREAVSLKQIADWPGMSAERGARLLNALYLCANLMVTRSHSSAQSEPRRSLFGLLSR